MTIFNTPEAGGSTRRTLRKTARDVIIFAVGALLFGLAEGAIDLGLPPEAAAIGGPIAMAAWRQMRDRYPMLERIDPK